VSHNGTFRRFYCRRVLFRVPGHSFPLAYGSMRALIVSAVLTATVALPAFGQSTAELAPAAPAAAAWTGDARLGAPVDASLLPVGLATAAAAPAAPVQARRARASVGPVLPAAIGAVLGGWVGYVASQVARSDWDKESNGEFSGYRMTFAAGGAAVGALTGVVLSRNLGPAHTPGSARAPRMVGSRNSVITADEIQNARALNALELVQKLRPRWLQTRGVNSMTETAQGTGSGTGGSTTVDVTPGVSPIKVYMDNALMGDVTVLRTINLGSFTEVRYYDSAQATYRWGEGHMGGAIEFLTTPVQQN
jgi:hypothetical protein